MKNKELKKILKEHLHWLKQDCKEWEKMRADLSYANLRGADLRGAELSYANLSCANLINADFQCANLIGADFRATKLCGADFRGAELGGANLEGANLIEALFCGAKLQDANLNRTEGLYIPMACPTEGEFVGWKIANTVNNQWKHVIVKLLITEDARRNSATTEKCRCDKAVTLAITSLDGKIQYKEARSLRDENFIYRVGQTAAISDFDENRFNECSTGIHFFVDKEAALRY